MKGAIPIKHIGDLHIMIADIVNMMGNQHVLSSLETASLMTIRNHMDAEITRRKQKETT